MSAINPENHDYPVFHTQGGGLVREVRNGGTYSYFFIEAPPNDPSIKVGDEMSQEWSIHPANDAARRTVFVL